MGRHRVESFRQKAVREGREAQAAANAMTAAAVEGVSAFNDAIAVLKERIDYLEDKLSLLADAVDAPESKAKGKKTKNDADSGGGE